MNIYIFAVGKISPKWIKAGIVDYSDRLKRFGRLEVIEVPEEKPEKTDTTKEFRKGIAREGHRLLQKMPKDGRFVALDRRGRTLGSEGLATLLEQVAVGGQSKVSFVIGGSYGLSEFVLDRCHQTISFGPNTFPHQLFRLILLEQLYRAQKIRSGQTYHK